MILPQLGKTHPAILATDDKGTIEAKVLGQLSRLRDAFDSHTARGKVSGVADDPGYSPNARLSIPCVYVDEESAVNIHDNAIHGLRFALDNLEAYGFFLIDTFDWRNADFTDENDEVLFPHHEIGVAYAIKVGDKIGHEAYRRREAERFINAKARFDRGELNSGGGGSIAELLRQLDQLAQRGR